MKKSKTDMIRTETRRLKRAQLEKQLQVSIEKHVTRTVDSVLTSTDMSKRHIELNAKLLITHTCERMRIVQGKKTFMRFALTDLSCKQFENIFWLVFISIFRKVSFLLFHNISYIKIEETEFAGEKSNYGINLFPIHQNAVIFTSKQRPYSSDLSIRNLERCLQWLSLLISGLTSFIRQ
jgi:hypothetical protein